MSPSWPLLTLARAAAEPSDTNDPAAVYPLPDIHVNPVIISSHRTISYLVIG